MEKGAAISAEDALYRRGYSTPEKKFLNPDGTPTSRVFKLRSKDEGKLSTNVKSLTTPEKSIEDPSKYLLFEIFVADVYLLGLSAIYDPLTLEENGIDNPAHSYIFGMDEEDDILPGSLSRKSKRVNI